MNTIVEPKDLSLTIANVVAYTNLSIDPEILFNYADPYPIVDPPRHPKKKTIDKKKVRAPKNKIIRIRMWGKFKGLNFNEDKKEWCSVSCQPMKETVTADGVIKYKKDKRMREVYDVIDGVSYISYYCPDCQKTYALSDLKLSITFRNQIQMTVSMGDYHVDVMFFNGSSFKIAGCKSLKDPKLLIKNFMSIYNDIIDWDNGPYEFGISPVMINTKFSLGFYIDRIKLKRILLSEKYRDLVVFVMDETTGSSQLKTTMKGPNLVYSKQDLADPKKTPPDDGYKYLRYWKDEDGDISLKEGKKPYLKYIKNKQKKSMITFVTFSSSETIVSGRNFSSIKDSIAKYTKIVTDNIDYIEETIRVPAGPLVL